MDHSGRTASVIGFGCAGCDQVGASTIGAEMVANQKQGLADVVTVDAWHDAFGNGAETADLHVDVVFMSGRFGGRAQEDVRFRLSLKAAEVVVVLPAHEPAAIDPRSVSRDAPSMSGQDNETRKSSRQASANLGLKGDAAATGMSAAASAGLEAGAAVSRERTLEITRAITGMTATQSRTDDGDYRWTVTPTIGAVLEGRPWSSDVPRLAIRDLRTDPALTLPPALRVEVRCRREDLHISDIALRDEGRWNVMKLSPHHRNKMKAAEALIRTRLFEEGLMTGTEDLSDPYARMTLTVVAVESVR